MAIDRRCEDRYWLFGFTKNVSNKMAERLTSIAYGESIELDADVKIDGSMTAELANDTMIALPHLPRPRFLGGSLQLDRVRHWRINRPIRTP